MKRCKSDTAFIFYFGSWVDYNLLISSFVIGLELIICFIDSFLLLFIIIICLVIIIHSSLFVYFLPFFFLEGVGLDDKFYWMN